MQVKVIPSTIPPNLEKNMFSHGLLGVWLSHHTNPLANNHPSTQWLGENSHPVISSATHLISQFCNLQPLLVAHSFPSYWLKHRFFSSHVTTMQKVMVAWGTPKKSRESGNHPSNTATLHCGSPFHTPTSHPQNQGRPLALRPAETHYREKGQRGRGWHVHFLLPNSSIE